MRGAKPELSASRRVGRHQFLIPQVPIEWLDASSWRLPSGKALAEFALQAGFLAPLLFKTESFTRGGGFRSPRPMEPSRSEAGSTEQLEKEGNR